jgi:heat shock protein HslJ
MRTAAAGTVFLMMSILACGGGAPSSPPASAGVVPSAAPTIQEAAAATYAGLPTGQVTLDGGRWEREAGDEPRARVTLADGFRVTGNLDADADDEAVVLLAVNTGASGTFDHLAMLKRRGEAVVNVATAELGDRVQVRGAAISDQRLVVDVVRAGPDDAMCCPGEKARLTFAWRDGSLARTGDDITGRASLEDLSDAEWVLVELASGEPAPADPAVTLQYRDSALAGRGGCNRYTAAVKPGAQPGEISIPRIVATRMSCPGSADALEHRYLRQLEAVQRYTFRAGRLLLTYKSENRPQSMTFEAADRTGTPASSAAEVEPHQPN